MPKTTPLADQRTANARRQAEYRERHLKAEEGSGARLNTLVTYTAKRSLDRLANHYGVTRKTMLERLIQAAENDVIGTLSGEKQSQYYDGA